MQTEQLKTTAIQALEDLKGADIAAYDVREMTSITDVMLIASEIGRASCRERV